MNSSALFFRMKNHKGTRVIEPRRVWRFNKMIYVLWGGLETEFVRRNRENLVS